MASANGSQGMWSTIVASGSKRVKTNGVVGLRTVQYHQHRSRRQCSAVQCSDGDYPKSLSSLHWQLACFWRTHDISVAAAAKSNTSNTPQHPFFYLLITSPRLLSTPGNESRNNRTHYTTGILARDVIYTSRAYATMSVSVSLLRKCIGAL